ARSRRAGPAPQVAHPAKDGLEEIRKPTPSTEEVVQVADIPGNATGGAGAGPVIPVKVSRRAALLPARIRVAKLFVAGAFLGIAQDFVSFVDFFELFFGLFISRIAIWVILERKFTESAFNFGF